MSKNIREVNNFIIFDRVEVKRHKKFLSSISNILIENDNEDLDFGIYFVSKSKFIPIISAYPGYNYCEEKAVEFEKIESTKQVAVDDFIKLFEEKQVLPIYDIKIGNFYCSLVIDLFLSADKNFYLAVNSNDKIYLSDGQRIDSILMELQHIYLYWYSLQFGSMNLTLYENNEFYDKLNKIINNNVQLKMNIKYSLIVMDNLMRTTVDGRVLLPKKLLDFAKNIKLD